VCTCSKDVSPRVTRNKESGREAAQGNQRPAKRGEETGSERIKRQETLKRLLPQWDSQLVRQIWGADHSSEFKGRLKIKNGI
jgi:hypothetical protein